MSGRCPECRVDADDFDHQDTQGTVRSWPVRWEWTLEGVPDDVRVAVGPPAAQPADVHAGEHQLYAAGRLVHQLRAGAPTMAGVVDRINASDGGVPKQAIDQASVGWRGLAGDRQATRKHHGRPGQAVSLWSAEVIEALAAEGHPIGPGRAGENLTVRGIDWASVRAGTIVEVGDVLLMLTGWADPCSNLRPWFTRGDFRRIDHGRHPGTSRAYASVLRPGVVHAGDAVTVEP